MKRLKLNILQRHPRIAGALIGGVLCFLAGLAFGAPAHASSPGLCSQGKIAFVQWRNQADLKIRFVTSNEDARISFRQNPTRSGQWQVVGRNENPDHLVYIDTYRRDDSINVKIVDSNSGCN